MTGVAKLRVLVTCPPMLGLFDEFVPTFAAHGLDADAAQVVQILTEDELIKRLPEYDGWIIGDDPASARVLEAGKAGRLKAIVKWGVGGDKDRKSGVSAKRVAVRVDLGCRRTNKKNQQYTDTYDCR